ncbi:hypothetical protein TD95_005021 [Thielaviopsis punctulata]|uniref:Uncharacterized protein n=1 Tax=Thielaviopsis punctulata TaxID=72032 RepID=A0A0F4ZHH2_9PEZI|nr:hypothetical protein TD95_005021 [Thielaviopsis punctulata]
MCEYNVQKEAHRILTENLLADEHLHPLIKTAAENIQIVGTDDKPWIPTPCKLTESAAALVSLVGAAASAVAADRYGIPLQKVTVDTSDLSTLFILSIMLPTINGEPFFQNDHMKAEIARSDLNHALKPIHLATTNIYPTADGKWYHLHGSMDARPTMRMLDIPEQDDLTHVQARALVAQRVAQHTAAALETCANDVFRQAGVTCLTPDAFLATPHGASVAQEPLWHRRAEPLAAPVAWPATATDECRPLAGIRVLDFSRVVAAPVISKILAALGASVLKIGTSTLPDIGLLLMDLSAGKHDAEVNLKTEAGRAAFEHVLRDADVLVDGYRPGVLERLGFPAQRLREINPRLVLVRENCYGWTGPLKHRSGWQQISDCLVGLSWLQGQFMGLDEPVVPLLPNSDYQTGLIGAAAVLEALLLRAHQPQTFTIDVSLTRYNIWYYHLGLYSAEQQDALRKRNPGFSVRHYDEMNGLLVKMTKQVAQVRPDLLTREEFFQKMSGVEWGLSEDDDVRILVPPFSMETSKVHYDTPSGRKGRSKAEWW